LTVIEKYSHEEINYWKLGTSWWGKPGIYVHSFLIDGLLIDTGHTYIKKEFLQVLSEKTINKVILTHHHEDHSSNVDAIKRQHKIEGFASPLCCNIMQEPPRLEPARRLTWGQNSAADLLPLDFSEKLETNSFSFDILETPGHAVDQISLHEKNRGWLFSGDIFIHDYVKSFMRDENIYHQIDSIKLLLELDFDALICNHQPVFHKGKKRLRNKLQFLEDLVGKVREEFIKTNSVSQTMNSLRIKENHFLKGFSLGQLSAKNMILSVISGIEK
jgi:ribonuclease/clavin/mitogillin